MGGEGGEWEPGYFMPAQPPLTFACVGHIQNVADEGGIQNPESASEGIGCKPLKLTLCGAHVASVRGARATYEW